MLKYLDLLSELEEMLDHFVTSSQLYYNEDFFKEIEAQIEHIKELLGGDAVLSSNDKDIIEDMTISLLEKASNEINI